jgi:hypothetical protein
MVKEKFIHSPPVMHAQWYCILHYSDLVQQAVKYSMYQFKHKGNSLLLINS